MVATPGRAVRRARGAATGDSGGAVADEAYYSSWESAVAVVVAGRRRLVRPGSSPPTCRSRCSGCHPTCSSRLRRHCCTDKV
uniref:Uncharacterized protein n=1 Tax=Oryza glumipatula TaxID=40148 RepID=A0A0D9ZIN1_9ORYZ